MFTKTREIEFIKPYWSLFALSVILSALYHTDGNSPVILITSHSFGINHSTDFLTVALYSGFLCILVSMIFKNFGCKEFERKTMSAARTALSISFGSVLGWLLVATYESGRLDYLLLGGLRYLQLLGIFWTLPNILHHLYKLCLRYHSPMTAPLLLTVTLAVTVSYFDVMKLISV